MNQRKQNKITISINLMDGVSEASMEGHMVFTYDKVGPGDITIQKFVYNLVTCIWSPAAVDIPTGFIDVQSIRTPYEEGAEKI
jgi:hypothetical protein